MYNDDNSLPQISIACFSIKNIENVINVKRKFVSVYTLNIAPSHRIQV